MLMSSIKEAYWYTQKLYGLVQACSISIANALEILQSGTKPYVDVLITNQKKNDIICAYHYSFVLFTTF